MSWYYADNREIIGPVGDSEFVDLVSNGKISPEPLVWNESLTGWKPFGTLDMVFP